MTSLVALWLPILLSAVLVFLASFVLHMALPWHKGDYRPLPDEARVLDALAPLAIPPGDYMAPRASSMEEMRSPEFAAKMRRGPVLVATVMPSGPMAIGRSLVFWFINALVMSVFAAYVSSWALAPAAPPRAVMLFASTTAFLGYAAALWQMVIWYRRSIGTTLRSTIDGLIYALITGVTMAWLWPQ